MTDLDFALLLGASHQDVRDYISLNRDKVMLHGRLEHNRRWPAHDGQGDFIFSSPYLSDADSP